jgi:hypothetical protein
MLNLNTVFGTQRPEKFRPKQRARREAVSSVGNISYSQAIKGTLAAVGIGISAALYLTPFKKESTQNRRNIYDPSGKYMMSGTTTSWNAESIAETDIVFALESHTSLAHKDPCPDSAYSIVWNCQPDTCTYLMEGIPYGETRSPYALYNMNLTGWEMRDLKLDSNSDITIEENKVALEKEIQNSLSQTLIENIPTDYQLKISKSWYRAAIEDRNVALIKSATTELNKGRKVFVRMGAHHWLTELATPLREWAEKQKYAVIIPDGISTTILNNRESAIYQIYSLSLKLHSNDSPKDLLKMGTKIPGFRENENVLITLAGLSSRNGQHTQAFSYLEQVLTLNPLSTIANLNMAHTIIMDVADIINGNPKPTISTVQEALKKVDFSSVKKHLQAVKRVTSGIPLKVIPSDFTQFAKLKEKYADVEYNYGAILKALKANNIPLK